MTTATAASPTHTPTGADYRPSSSLVSPATDATTDDEDASAPSTSGRPPSASGEDVVDSSIGAVWAGTYCTAASARRRGGARRACLAATRVAALSMLLPLTHQVWALGCRDRANCSERGTTAQQGYGEWTRRYVSGRVLVKAKAVASDSKTLEQKS